MCMSTLNYCIAAALWKLAFLSPSLLLPSRRCWQGERPAVAELRPVQRGAHSPRLSQSGPEATQRRQLQAAQHQEDRLRVRILSVPPSAPPLFFSSSSPSSTTNPAKPSRPHRCTQTTHLQCPPSLLSPLTAVALHSARKRRKRRRTRSIKSFLELLGGKLWTSRWKGIRHQVEVEVSFCANWALDANISILPRRRSKISEPEAAAATFFYFFFQDSHRESQSENSIWFFNNMSLCWVLFFSLRFCSDSTLQTWTRRTKRRW